jgi:hypothetical protein
LVDLCMHDVDEICATDVSQRKVDTCPFIIVSLRSRQVLLHNTQEKQNYRVIHHVAGASHKSYNLFNVKMRHGLKLVINSNKVVNTDAIILVH